MRRGVRRFVGDRVVVHSHDGRSLRGVLTGVFSDCVVVSAVEYLDEANPVGPPGQAVVLRANVSWIHRLSEGGA